jgi:hypothetical protein
LSFHLLVSLLTFQTIWCWVLGWQVNSELEWVWNGVGSCWGMVLLLSWHLAGKTEENNDKHHSGQLNVSGELNWDLWIRSRSVISLAMMFSIHFVSALSYMTGLGTGSWTVPSVALASHTVNHSDYSSTLRNFVHGLYLSVLYDSYDKHHLFP